ncbi:MAG: fructosamine kinase family protein [Bacteroidota bacterium]
MLSSTIKNSIEQQLQVRINSSRICAGGSINEAYLLETSSGTFFLKQNDSAIAANLLRAEVEGLRTLGGKSGIRVPDILLEGQVGHTAFLVLEFIPSGRKSSAFWEQFGYTLARLHRHTAENFGFSSDNYIGALPQYNPAFASWTDFYRTARLRPQLDMAKQQNKLSFKDENAFERLFAQWHNYFPAEAPALTHGDLWSGNFLCNEAESVVLIDPAVSYAHREMDIAMTYLFGGFSAIFYESYQAHFPLAPQFDERLALYQLYYLMVHVNLFGGSYVQSVRRILKRYV